MVRLPAPSQPLTTAIEPATLLPISGTRYMEITNNIDGDLHGFGGRFARLLAAAIRQAGGKGRLQRMTYSDRYLRSPLTSRLPAETSSALRD